jgi:hypothetical protein
MGRNDLGKPRIGGPVDDQDFDARFPSQAGQYR